MDTVTLLQDAFDRVSQGVAAATEGLSAEALAFRPDADANSIAWLVWHLTRVHDDHLASLAGRDQVWTVDGWSSRFDLPFGDREIGYGHSSDQVAAVTVDGPELLVGYHEAVANQTPGHLRTIIDQGLGRVVDERYDPPVTAGVRVISVVNDTTQHIGQAAYVRGLVQRRGLA